MRLHIASDLHLEFLEQRFPNYTGLADVPADLLVLAGDIHRDSRGIAAFSSWPTPVVYVYGNHEMYKQHLFQQLDRMRFFAADGNVHFLEKDVFVHNGVRFLGCCLWTDYLLFGPDLQDECMEVARQQLNDHNRIRTHYRMFLPKDAAHIHANSVAWLESKLREDFAGKTVVVTHHSPHPKSCHERYAGQLLNAAFHSDLSRLIESYQPALWIHGHTHDNADYHIGATRVVCNPRGYPLSGARKGEPNTQQYENFAFNPGLVVEI